MATAVASAEPVARRWRLRLPERLPNLKGKWLTFYTLVWAVLLPFCLYGTARGNFIALTTPTMWSPYGFSTTEDTHGIHVDVVDSPSVQRTGIAPGDYVIAVDGWQVPQVAARAAAREHVIKPEGSYTTFTLRRPTGEIYNLRLERSVRIEEEAFRAAGLNRTFAMTFARASIALTPLLFLAAAILLFLRRRQEAVPALLSLSFLLFAGIVNSPDLLGISIWLVAAISILAVCLLLAALFAFPSGRFEPRWTAVPFLLLPSFFLIVLWPDASAFGSVMGLIFFVLALVALVLRYRQLEDGAEKQQLRWAFFGLVLGIIFQLLGLAVQLAVGAWQAEDPRWSEWGYIFSILGVLSFGSMTLGLMVSILRYRLYDADAIIGRSAAYGVLTIGFVALFAASEKIIELLGQQYLGQNIGALAGGIGAALAAVAIAPMHARTHRWAERRFQKALYRLRHGLPALVGDLRETSGVHQIAAATLDTVMDGVRARRSALIAVGTLVDAREVDAADVARWQAGWVPAAHDGTDIDEADDFFPVRVPLEAEGHGRVGWLLLGSRPDGTMFGKAERDAIEEIAEPVARAVQVALTREKREAAYDKRLQTLEDGFEKLKSMIANLTVGSSPTLKR